MGHNGGMKKFWEEGTNLLWMIEGSHSSVHALDGEKTVEGVGAGSPLLGKKDKGGPGSSSLFFTVGCPGRPR